MGTENSDPTPDDVWQDVEAKRKADENVAEAEITEWTATGVEPTEDPRRPGEKN